MITLQHLILRLEKEEREKVLSDVFLETFNTIWSDIAKTIFETNIEVCIKKDKKIKEEELRSLLLMNKEELLKTYKQYLKDDHKIFKIIVGEQGRYFYAHFLKTIDEYIYLN